MSDDIFGKDLFEENEKENDFPQINPPNNKKEFFIEKNIPQLQGDGYPERFLEIVKKVQERYEEFPSLSYKEIAEEVSSLNVYSCPTPTLQSLNYEMEKVQAAKDRISEIYSMVMPSYNAKKRLTELLSTCWNEYATGKTKDLRESDCASRLNEFLIDLSESERINSLCTQILKNLESLHHTLSRRITIFQLQLSLRDIGRGALPDYEFQDEDGVNSDEIPQDISEIINGKSPSTKESIEADEEGF